MEPSTSTFIGLLSPTAAYCRNDARSRPTIKSEATDSENSFDQRSALTSTQSQACSLFPYSQEIRNEDEAWHFGGVDVDGTRFFIVPTFAMGKPPLRIDVFIPPQEQHNRWAKAALEPQKAVLSQHTAKATQDAITTTKTAMTLRVVRHILTALARWSANQGDNFMSRYWSMNFGSQIIFQSLQEHTDKQHEEILLVPVYEVERHWHSVTSLRDMWRQGSQLLPSKSTVYEWPPLVSWDDLQLKDQSHEAISLVTIPRLHGEETLVFKSLTRDTKYLYHEIRMLLSMEPHPNVVGRPRYLVTKRCRFGGKQGVCGFVVEFLPLGNLRDVLVNSKNKVDGREEKRNAGVHQTELGVGYIDRCRWAQQVTEALIHMQQPPLNYYPDIKPDNVMLRMNNARVDAMIIDFEQRGGWYSWSPPEVAYIDFIEFVASSSTSSSLEHQKQQRERHVEDVASFTDLLRQYDPSWQPLNKTSKYSGIMEGGFSTAWRNLSRPELEAAQVFMLGKLLWCVFEGQGSVNSGLSPDVLRETDPEHEFPMFRTTPVELRECIAQSTRGASEWKGKKRPVRMYCDSLDVEGRTSTGVSGDADAPDVAVMVQNAASEWWEDMLHDAQDYLRHRLTQKRKDGKVNCYSECDYPVCQDARQRPTLPQILEILREKSTLPM